MWKELREGVVSSDLQFTTYTSTIKYMTSPLTLNMLVSFKFHEWHNVDSVHDYEVNRYYVIMTS